MSMTKNLAKKFEVLRVYPQKVILNKQVLGNAIYYVFCLPNLPGVSCKLLIFVM